MSLELAKDKPKIWTLEEMRKYHLLIMQAAEELNSRLFVILAAQANGWNFARKLQFLESGISFVGYMFFTAPFSNSIFHIKQEVARTKTI